MPDTAPTLLLTLYGQLSQATSSTSLLVLHTFVGTEDALYDCSKRHPSGQVGNIAECVLPSITALVNSEASHCFVACSIVVDHVLPCQADVPIMVMLADGSSLVFRAAAYILVLRAHGLHCLHNIQQWCCTAATGLQCIRHPLRYIYMPS